MKRTYGFLAAVAAVVAIGCGGGGSSGNNGGTSGADVEAQINAGRTSLSTVLVDGGSSNEVSQHLNAAVNSFNAAANAAPNNPRAAVGYAIARAGATAQNLVTTFGVEMDADFRTGTPVENVASSLNVVNPNLNLGYWTRPFELKNVLPLMLAPDSRAYPNNPTHAQVVQAITTAEAQLETAVVRLTDARINALESDPLQLQYRENGTVKTVKIGTVEGYALRAALKAAQGFMDAALAYNLDPGNFHFDNPFLATFNTQLATSGGVGPETYLPGNGFLALANGGAARLQAFGTKWVGAADDATATIQKYRTRTGTGWVTDSLNVSATQINSAESAIGQFKSFLTSQQAVPVRNGNGVTGTLTINIPAWTDGTPPADLKAFFPNLRGVPDDMGDTLIWPIEGSIEDRTYGGLFPVGGGVSEALLYDRDYFLVNEDPTSNAVIAFWAFAFFDLGSTD